MGLPSSPRGRRGERLCSTVVNDRVASSGERAVFMALSLPRAAVYGCNTLGIGRFGDDTLPHSHTTLWCPQKAFEEAPEEGGYELDVWIDSQDVTGGR